MRYGIATVVFVALGMELGEGGWVRVDGVPGVEEVEIRVAETSGGRFAIVEIRLDASVITADVMRAIPIGKIEAGINGPGVVDDIRDLASLPNPGRFVSAGEFERPASRWAGRAQLKVPAERKKPDEFYARVARLFSELSLRDSSPAVTIARANDVPPSTVHRWVKEARRRGLLAPGQRGRAR